MVGKKGFSLAEIIVTVIIMGIIACIAVPNYVSYIQQGTANAAQNNLTAIYAAQKNYYYTTGSYCVNSPCADSTAHINSSLSLNITDSYYTYACVSFETTGFQCTATNIANPTITYTTTGTLTP